MVQKQWDQATYLDEPVAIGTVVNDRQGLLESGSPNPDNICYQLADGNNDLRDTIVSKSINLQMMLQAQLLLPVRMCMRTGQRGSSAQGSH